MHDFLQSKNMEIEQLYTPLWQTLLPALVALVTVRWFYFKILRIAKAKNLVDSPDARKLQTEPVPVMGGIAVFFGVVCGVLVGSMLVDATCLLPAVLGMVVLLYFGAMDDIVGMSQLSRLVAETLVIIGLIFASGKCVDSLHGLWGINQLSWWMAVPLTVFACVGVINAMNMIDGVNGLSSGLCLTCAGLFGVVFLRQGDIANAMLAFAMMAALVPFLLHNVFGKSSRMFIGDAGTMIMGALMSWFMITLLSADGATIDNRLNPVALALAILALPVFDTLRVMMQRLLHGISPFRADKTHLHHAFIEVGMSHSITALSEIMIDALIVLCWFIAYRLGASVDAQFYIVFATAILFVWGTYALLWFGSKDNAWGRWLRTIMPHTHLGHTPWWLKIQAYMDAPETATPLTQRFRKQKFNQAENKK